MMFWIIAVIIAFCVGFSLGERSECRRIKKILGGFNEGKN